MLIMKVLMLILLLSPPHEYCDKWERDTHGTSQCVHWHTALAPNTSVSSQDVPRGSLQANVGTFGTGNILKLLSSQNLGALPIVVASILFVIFISFAFGHRGSGRRMQ